VVPSWIWFFAKLAVIIFSYLWVRATFPRVRIDQLMRFAWLCMIPMTLVTLPAAGIWALLIRSGHPWWAWLITVPLLLIPWVIMASIYNRRLAPSTRTYHFAES
jgi:NADH-quinone oxidoreductase subunit H